MFDFDPVLLARIQFAFTIAYHIIFPAISIGSASFLTVVELRWLMTRNEVYKDIYLFWVKIFAVVFGVGVVTGVVMAYQFGTNWSVFSDKVGNIIGPLMGYEVLSAFFLEASFLGVMLFGWGRVSERMHFVSTAIVALGTLFSAFWILSVNSWMQTPAGYRIDELGIFHPADWIEIIFNPSFHFRLAHMVVAAYLSTAFFVGGVAAYYLLKKRYLEQAKVMFAMAMLMAVFIAPLQAFLGDAHGLNTLEHQPAKVAAMEGLWETEKGPALRLFAWPDQEAQKNDFEIKIPYLASIILTHSLDGEVKGLKHWDADEIPPVLPVFLSFRVMLGIGFLMIFTGLIAVVLYFKKRLFDTKWFLRWCVLMMPSGVIALLAGWFVTEIGRQPYTVYGLLKTSDSVSPVLGPQVAWSLATFIVVYIFVFGFASFYIARHIQRGMHYFKKGKSDSVRNNDPYIEGRTK